MLEFPATPEAGSVRRPLEGALAIPETALLLSLVPATQEVPEARGHRPRRDSAAPEAHVHLAHVSGEQRVGKSMVVVVLRKGYPLLIIMKTRLKIADPSAEGHIAFGRSIVVALHHESAALFKAHH